MQYENKAQASEARAVIRFMYAVLGILVILAFLADNETLTALQWPILGLFVAFVLLTYIGGLSELSLVAEDDYVELRSTPILAAKGKTHTYTIEAEKLLRYRYTVILFLRYLSVEYISHSGVTKKAHVGLTLMDGSRREAFIKKLKKITTNNRQQ